MTKKHGQSVGEAGYAEKSRHTSQDIELMAQELGGSHPGLPTGDVFWARAWCAVVTQLTTENDEPLFQVEYNY